MATLGMSAADKDAIEAFRRDVIDPSMESLVILDFWAEWCGPCKTLTPVLEKVAAKYADRGVLLVKVNVDENKLIAAQFRVQSIPTVYALFQGKLVADLTPARTEGQLGQMLDQILQQLPVSGDVVGQAEDIAPLIAMGEEVLENGEGARALAIFTQLADMAPADPAVLSGRTRALIATGAIAEARALIDSLPPELLKVPAIARAQAATTLAEDARPVDDLAGLAAKVAAEPDNLEVRFELAGGLMAEGDRDGAADALLDMIARDRTWREGAARDRLLNLFEVVGLEDPWVSAQRRRLSAILFT